MKKSLGSWRRERNISQEKMATMLGVTTATLSKYEHNPTRLKVGVLLKICRILEIDITQIFLT